MISITVDWSVETVPDIGSASGINEATGSKSCDITTILAYDTTYTWYVNVTDSGSGITISEIFSFTTIAEATPEIEIKLKSPVAGGLYLKDKLLTVTKIPFAVIIGGIDLEIEVKNPGDVEINNITLFIDNVPLETVVYNPLNDTYKVTWDERVIGMSTVSVVLKYDSVEKITDEMDVFILNLNLT